MGSLNKVLLAGRLGRDPEIRYTKSGGAVANFSIATDERWKDKEGNRQERTEWHSIVAWGRLADLAQNYLTKGRMVLVEGRLQTRDWTDNANVKHYRTEVVADNIQFMEKLEEGQRGGGAPPRAGQERPAQQDRQQGRGGAPHPEDSGPPMDDGAYLEDDIPF
jgi:single-strand DNA-binding protein